MKINDITAVIISRNEESKIAKCIASLGFCRNIVIIDDYSTDKTALIAQKNGALVYKRHLNNDFSAQRNFGLSKSTSEWTIFVDADEVISPELANELGTKKLISTYNGYLILRSDLFEGKLMLGGEFNTKLLRLGKTNAGKWVRKVHEVWDIRGEIGVLHGSIIHESHEDLGQFVKQIGFYSKLHSEEKEREIENVYFWQLIFYPLGKFIYNFIFLKGYRDGIHGFVSAILMSFHSFISWTQLWLNKN